MNNLTKNVKTASIIQIVLGVITVIITQFLLKNGDATSSGLSTSGMFLQLGLIYAGAALQILAGIVGLASMNKKSLLAVILGVLIYIPQLWNLFATRNSISLIVVHIVLLVITYYYVHSVYQNYKSR